MITLIPLQGPLALETRKRQQVANVLDETLPHAGVALEVQSYKQRHLAAYHRDVGPCSSYNCHGLTFAARRTAIDDSSEVRKILDDDGYEEIPGSETCGGDIAVYFVYGDVEHSGIVVERGELGPKILSKWGAAHEVIHNLGDCPYDASNVRFYRLKK